MDRINGADPVNIGGGKRGFRSENLGAGIVGTEVTDTWLNDVQENLLKIIEDAGFAPAASDWTQLASGIIRLVRRTADFQVVGYQTAPPGGPADGDAYVVKSPATGAWVGQDNKIAEYLEGGWSYRSPLAGLQVHYWSARQIVLRFDGAVWAEDLATDVAAGRVELATNAEARAFLSSVLAVTPAGLGAAIGDISTGVSRNISIYTTPGTVGWVCPANVFRVRARVWAPGGGGGGSSNTPGSVASAAASGGYSEGVYSVTPGVSYPVVIGQPGLGGNGTISPATPTVGIAGGTTSFGGMISVTGGGPGNPADGGIALTPGFPGSGSGGQLNLTGSLGGSGYPIGSGNYVLAQGGAAFSSTFTATYVSGVKLNGSQGSFPGGGGGGGILGGNGGPGGGALLILEY